MRKILNEIANDTLKKKTPEGTREWSRTSLTMFTAFMLACGAFVYSVIAEGFRFDAFSAMLATGLGAKLVDAKSKQIEKSN